MALSSQIPFSSFFFFRGRSTEKSFSWRGPLLHPRLYFYPASATYRENPLTWTHLCDSVVGFFFTTTFLLPFCKRHSVRPSWAREASLFPHRWRFHPHSSARSSQLGFSLRFSPSPPSPGRETSFVPRSTRTGVSQTVPLLRFTSSLTAADFFLSRPENPPVLS